ncbi:hypothetical protein ACVJMY_006533 [Bradyrhizobium diazoefficiens]
MHHDWPIWLLIVAVVLFDVVLVATLVLRLI